MLNLIYALVIIVATSLEAVAGLDGCGAGEAAARGDGGGHCEVESCGRPAVNGDLVRHASDKGGG